MPTWAFTDSNNYRRKHPICRGQKKVAHISGGHTLLKNKENLRHVQEPMSHLWLAATGRYLRLTIADLKEALEFIPHKKDARKH